MAIPLKGRPLHNIVDLVELGVGEPLLAHLALDGQPKAGYVRLVTLTGPPVTLDLFTTREPFMLAESYDGISTVPRIGGVGLTQSEGSNPLAQQLDVLLIANPAGDIEDAWQTLERIARPPNGARRPTLRLGGPIFHADRRWVIRSLEPDEDDLERDALGALRRIAATIVVQQDVTASLEGDDGPTTALDRKVPHVAHVQAGESIADVAKRTLGSRRRGRELARLNGLRDPNRRPRKGTELVLPDDA
jgi:hypothetical protein